ncbi:MAG: Rpn family recombination-promoting nuclease/putative transposase [Phascolarctobacterium sp.]|uniref:Rpn family recombination-promoting nuclease/putative transposase n=1 Tax=Phascolarctobacterium sp. TaxID=2049039 RepID=UPI0026DAB44F|nr:Rpn family recombination-promoting nuclease/putative transposase [Phascolarctobacterium sp.]MDO4921779.1 Rpn family recombination-promoting nuclease/putative transposase [Phascolarctobacterium sp.]
MTKNSFDTLPISNDFMFKKVMENKRLCKKLVGAIMQKKIADIIYTETEKTIEPYYDSRGVRLDVIIADDKRTRYNLEMQVKNTLGDISGEPVLPKRTRYYQSIMDMDMLQKGQDFDELNPLVLVFICAFDFFNEGRYVYTFKSRCLENLALELKNEVTVLLLNSQGMRGNVTPLVKNFLRYVNENVPIDKFTQEVETEVVRLRQDKKARREYMVLSTRLKDERMEGRREERAARNRDIALDMLKDKYTLAQILKLSRLSKEEIYALAQANGLQVVE